MTSRVDFRGWLRPILLTGLILLVWGGSVLSPGLVGPVLAETPSATRVPTPCFVPPPPQKLGFQPGSQAPLPGSEARAAKALALGGPAFGYRDDHLTGLHHPAGEPRHFNVICILADFDDQAMGSVLEDAPEGKTIHDYFNRVMTHLSQQYSQMSDGLVTIDWTLTDKVYRLPELMAYYGLDDSIATREAELCQDAVQTADPDIDFRPYNSFVTFHAGGGQEADINDDSHDQIWSVFFRQFDFSFWLDAEDREFGIRTMDMVGDDPFYVTSMVIMPEYETQDGYEFGMQGVVAHEYGHSFGIPDLYDTTAPEGFVFAESQGIGTFGLMGAGIWNANGFFPAEFCGWSRFYAGWSVPTILRAEAGDGGLVEVNAIQHDRRGALVRIPLGGDEYFLIENRIRDYNGDGEFTFDDADSSGTFDFWDDSYATIDGNQAEFDWHLPQEFGGPTESRPDGSGLLIWHVDESIMSTYLMYNLVNAEPLHKGLDLEEADGIQDLDKLEFVFEAFGDPLDSWFAPNATEFTPDSEPNTDGYNDAYSGVWITDISEPGPTMSFRLRFADIEGRVGDFVSGWPLDLTGTVGDFQPITGDLNRDGIQEIIITAMETESVGTVSIFRPDGTPYRGEDAVVYRGQVRSEPILVPLEGPGDDQPEVVFVAGNGLFAMTGTGSWINSQGFQSGIPVPFAQLERDPGRVEISAGDLDLDGRNEVYVATPTASPIEEISDWSNLRAYSLTGDGVRMLAVQSHRGTMPRAASVGDLDSVDRGLGELITVVEDRGSSYLAVGLITGQLPDDTYDVQEARWSPGEGIRLTAPVIGDLDRDGVDDIIVADSRGYVHALNIRVATSDGVTKLPCPADGNCDFVVPGSGNRPEPCFHTSCFSELPGWPVETGSTADDDLSLADVDGDGYLEVLAMGPIDRLWMINYNGTVNVATPVNVASELKFDDGYLSALVLDADPAAGAEIVLPLYDGQVRALDSRGKSTPGWSYLGGGNQDSYPVITDLDGNGTLELITLEDVTIAIPEDIRTGDTSPGLTRSGRVIVRQLAEGTAEGPWPVYRANPLRNGYVSAPSSEAAQPDGGTASGEVFVFPNPVVTRTAGLHYTVRSDVDRVLIRIHDATGTEVIQLSGSIDEGTDNVVDWDLTNDQGNAVAPGLYFARFTFEASGSSEVKIAKFVVTR